MWRIPPPTVWRCFCARSLSGVWRIQDPSGKEARRSTCRFLAPGARADRGLA